MNECCDWHAVCLNDQEIISNDSVIYLSYCPECNSLLEYDNNTVKTLEGKQKDLYFQKYKEKINTIKTLVN